LPVLIDEGLVFHIGAVAIEGVSRRPENDVRRLFGLEPGAPYDPLGVEPARRRVEVSYLESGYARVRATARVAADPKANTVDVTLEVDEGPREVLADVTVQGATATSRGTIDHSLDLPAGEPLNMGAIYSAQKRLYDTGVFRTVDISVAPVDATSDPTSAVQPVRASVTLQELPRYQFRYGFRVVDDANPAEGARSVRPGLMADLLNRNVFGHAVTAGVAGQIETDRFLARGILSFPTLLGLPVTSNLFLTRSRQDFAPGAGTEFREDATEITAEQRFRPARTTLVTYGYSFARTHTFDPSPDPNSPLPPLDFLTNVARLSGNYAWDTRDDPSNPARGWLHSSGLEYGPEVLGSDLRFLRYLGQQYYFRTIGERFTLASAVRVGAGRGFDQDLIPSEKFYAGGGTTVRGFAEQDLGPKNFFGDPLGGNSMLILNQEARFRVHRWASVVGFLDAGNVFQRASDLSFSGLEAGTGLGLRVISPFAILRVDVGFPLTSGRDQPSARWYFGIGQTY
jgi:outer membrane protein assembly factor BamA